MIYKEFNAQHALFYESFEKWRKEMLKLKEPINGVYQLIANKSIGRLLKSDEEGILYIGKGDILSNQTRVGKFINTLNDTERKHEAGFRYNSNAIKSKFPIKDSTVRITLTRDAEKLESILLEKYLQEYGELPPLNRRNESK